LIVKGTKGKMIEDLIPVLDNFEQAEQAVEATTEGEEKINNAYKNFYAQMVQKFKDMGLVPIEAVGNKFDPIMHDSTMTEETADHEDGTVLRETQKGYTHEGKVLRKASVTVARKPTPPAAPVEEEASLEEAKPEAKKDAEEDI